MLSHDGAEQSASAIRQRNLAHADHLATLHATWAADTQASRYDRHRDLITAALPPGHRQPLAPGPLAVLLLHAAELAGLDPPKSSAPPSHPGTWPDPATSPPSSTPGSVRASTCCSPSRKALDRPGGSRITLTGPAAFLVAANWEALATAPAVLTHYDFWSGNTVWKDGTLTGVVDWSGAALGPRGFDLGRCRLDLRLLFNQRIADRFLEPYQAASRVASPDPLLCDLWAAARSHHDVESWVPNYRDLGRADLTARALRERHTAWTQHLSDRDRELDLLT